jgi:ABC-type transport system substrate-binding protein
MDEHAIRELVADVKNERLSRRCFLDTMLGVGVTMPMVANLLSAAGVAHAQPKTTTAAPTRRGGGGQVRMLYWAAPTLLNPHLAVAPKDFESSQLFYEPLADIDTDGTIMPVLAAETPSFANGGVARDGTSVVWRLKRGVTWHDGRPFTADDVIFTWQYAADPATAATSAGSYQGIDRIDRIDDHTVKVVFKRPTPYWADAFCSAAGMVLPRHLFEPFRANVEYIQLSQTDPWREVEGERASVRTPHPFLTDPAVRSAFALLVDRGSIQKDIWGRQADTTANFMNRPPFASPNTRWEFSLDKANAILDAAGWKRGADGIRAKDGVRLKVLFQTVNQPIRQKMQSIIKQACVRAGIECELKSVVGSVYFSSDPGNVDTESHFYADLELSGKILRQPDPQAFMRAFCSWEVAQKANKWSGANLTRWPNDEYDRLWRAAETELDPTKRAAQFIRMNDLVVQNVVVIPVFVRHATFAVANWVRGFDFSPFSGPLWRLAFWSRES